MLSPVMGLLATGLMLGPTPSLRAVVVPRSCRGALIRAQAGPVERWANDAATADTAGTAAVMQPITDSPTDQPINRPIARPNNQQTYRSTHPPTDPTINCQTDRLTNRPTK